MSKKDARSWISHLYYILKTLEQSSHPGPGSIRLNQPFPPSKPSVVRSRTLRIFPHSDLISQYYPLPSLSGPKHSFPLQEYWNGWLAFLPYFSPSSSNVSPNHTSPTTLSLAL